LAAYEEKFIRCEQGKFFSNTPLEKLMNSVEFQLNNSSKFHHKSQRYILRVVKVTLSPNQIVRHKKGI
jgi:hypothetical protein